MNEPSKSADKLASMIKKAIEDQKLTSTERERIMMTADEDGVIDPQERRLLAELQNMIENGMVKVIPD
jgi:tellurite resistance protein